MRIRQWPRYPTTATSFNPPATGAEIQALEKVLGFRLPDELLNSLSVHNGQTDPYSVLGLTLDGTLINTVAIATCWQELTAVDESFWQTDPDWGKIEWWNPKWVPVVDNRAGDVLCINMDRSSR